MHAIRQGGHLVEEKRQVAERLNSLCLLDNDRAEFQDLVDCEVAIDRNNCQHFSTSDVTQYIRKFSVKHRVPASHFGRQLIERHVKSRSSTPLFTTAKHQSSVAQYDVWKQLYKTRARLISAIPDHREI